MHQQSPYQLHSQQPHTQTYNESPQRLTAVRSSLGNFLIKNYYYQRIKAKSFEVHSK